MKSLPSFIIASLGLALVVIVIIIIISLILQWGPIVYVSCSVAAGILITILASKGYRQRQKQLRQVAADKQRVVKGRGLPCPSESYVYQTGDCQNGELTSYTMNKLHPSKNLGCYNMSERLFNSERYKCKNMPVVSKEEMALIDETHPWESIKMIWKVFTGKAQEELDEVKAKADNALNEYRNIENKLVSEMTLKVDNAKQAASEKFQDISNVVSQKTQEVKEAVGNKMIEVGTAFLSNDVGNRINNGMEKMSKTLIPDDDHKRVQFWEPVEESNFNDENNIFDIDVVDPTIHSSDKTNKSTS